MAGDSDSLSTLLCLGEKEVEKDSIFEEGDDDLGVSGADQIDDEYLQILLEREASYGLVQSSSPVPVHDWIKCARLNAISWILKARELMGFHYQTAYLSLTYFDRFLSRRFIDIDKQWAIELLSVACLSLAAKMEEYKVPLLSSFPAQDYIFENRFIQRMELLVLSTLEWRLTCVTPFSYLVYFFKKLHRDDDPSAPRDALSRAASLILSATRDSNLIRHRPSVIAGAATLTVFYQKLTRPDLEAKIDDNNDVSSLFRVIQIEDLHSCYVRMQEIYMERRAAAAASSNSTTPAQAQFLHTSHSPPSNNKRKRLTFDNSSTDQKKRS